MEDVPYFLIGLCLSVIVLAGIIVIRRKKYKK